MGACSAAGCSASGVHLFPKNQEMRKRWELALNRENFKSSSSSRLCSAHFKAEDFATSPYKTINYCDRKILKKTAVPSIFIEEPYNMRHRKRMSGIPIDPHLKKQKLEEDLHTQIKLEAEEDQDVDEPIVQIQLYSEIKEEAVDDDSDIEVFDIRPPTHNPIFTVARFKENSEAFSFYTGLDSFKVFESIFNSLLPEANSINTYYSVPVNLPVEDQFLLTLVKLKRNQEANELSVLFDVPKASVAHIFCAWINFIYTKWSEVWPSNENLSMYMPEVFKNLYPTAKALIDHNNVKLICVSKPKPDSKTDNPDQLPVIKDTMSLSSDENEENIKTDEKDPLEETTKIEVPTPIKEIKQEHPRIVRKPLQVQKVDVKRVVKISNSYKMLQSPLRKCYLSIASKIYGCCHMLSDFKEGVVYLCDS